MVKFEKLIREEKLHEVKRRRWMFYGISLVAVVGLFIGSFFTGDWTMFEGGLMFALGLACYEWFIIRFQ